MQFPRWAALLGIDRGQLFAEDATHEREAIPTALDPPQAWHGPGPGRDGD